MLFKYETPFFIMFILKYCTFPFFKFIELNKNLFFKHRLITFISEAELLHARMYVWAVDVLLSVFEFILIIYVCRSNNNCENQKDMPLFPVYVV